MYRDASGPGHPCLVVVYGVAAISAPWSFYIGGIPTPLLSWSATGMLRSKGGNYPPYVFLYPASHFSRLRVDSLRLTGDVQGLGWLCTSQNVAQRGVISTCMAGGTEPNL
jgi:hypothetical protein